MAAVKLGQRLQTVRFAAAYTSDLKRTYTTARLILKENEYPHVTIYQDPDLREMNFGRFEEEKNRQVLPAVLHSIGVINLWRAFYHSQHASHLTDLFQQAEQTSNIENSQQLNERIRRALKYIGRKYDQDQTDNNILVVAHALILSVFIESLNGKVPKFLLKNVQVCQVDYQAGRFELKMDSKN
jgi:probable phosphoglycerate mutase